MTTDNGNPKCLACISDYNMAKRKGFPGESLPAIQDAITLAPIWVSQSIGGQTVMACVAVPSCMDHLETKEKSPEQRASESGLLLGGG